MTQDYVDLVPSGDKEAFWADYIANIEDSFDFSQPTADVLKQLHRFVAQREDSGISGNLEKKLEFRLYTQDRPDAANKMRQLYTLMGVLATISPLDQREISTLSRVYLRALCEEDTEIELTPTLAGNVRVLGRRSIDEGPMVTVHGSHNYALEAVENKKGGIYVGLAQGVDEVYNQLCRKYDEIVRGSRDLKGYLEAQAFLQLGGVVLLHPFFDGNGRTFLAHLGSSLNVGGVDVTDYGVMKRIGEKLTSVSDRLLTEDFLPLYKLPLLDGTDIFHLDPEFRDSYMRRLRESLDAYVASGIDEDGMFYMSITNAAWQVKRVLLQEGKLSATPYDSRRLEFEQKVAARVGGDPENPILIRPQIEGYFDNLSWPIDALVDFTIEQSGQ